MSVSVEPPSATVPVTLSWSWFVAALPGVVPPISTANVEPLANDTLPVFRIPGLVPGATVPPLATLTVPPTVPCPPRVPLLLTETALPEAVEPLTTRVPALIVVAPVYVLAPLKVVVPLVDCVRPFPPARMALTDPVFV